MVDARSARVAVTRRTNAQRSFPALEEVSPNHTSACFEKNNLDREVKALAEMSEAMTTRRNTRTGSSEGFEEVLVDVRDLKMHFPVTDGAFFPRVVAHVKAVDGVSFQVFRGETLGVVGESGCGKTTTGRCILQLEKPTAGEIMFAVRISLKLNSKEMIDVRKKIQVIFQDPYSSLNPRMKVGEILAEPMRVHKSFATEADRQDPGSASFECMWSGICVC